MRRILPSTSAALLGVLAAALVACGGSNPHLIPGDEANRLQDQIGQIREAVAAGQCDDIDSLITDAKTEVGQLPSSTSERLTNRIYSGLNHLHAIAPEECQSRVNEQEQTQTTETTTEPTDTTTLPTTTETTTTPTDTTTTQTTTGTTTTPTNTTTTQTTTGTGGQAAPPDTGGTSAPGGGAGKGGG